MRGALADEVERRMKALGMNAKHLSRAAGLNETFVRDVLKGKSQNPLMANVEKLADALHCEITDLQPPIQKMGREQAPRVASDLPDGVHERTTRVEEIGVFVGMGGGGVFDLEPINGTWQLPTDWLRQEVRGDLGQVKVLTVEGDSMAGTLAPGDKVVIDLNRRVPSPPGLFVLYDGTALVAKRLEVIEGSQPPRVRVSSDNTRYAPYERTADEIHIVGRIMARWERLG